MFKIVDFNKSHIEEAKKLALLNYNEEWHAVKDLPYVDEVPDLNGFVKNELGVAMFDNDTMIGFLCCHDPWENAFTTAARGTFSPIHAHGAIFKDRSAVYKKLYQAAAEKWVKKGISSHSMGLYAHDAGAIDAFFHYGFGLRCIDAIRPLTVLECTACDSHIGFEEIPKHEEIKIRELRYLLHDHLAQSPCFMYSSPEKYEHWIKRAETRDSRVFIAKQKEKIIAYLEIIDEGENFATEVRDMMNICGAFCFPEYRGKGIVQNLLNFIIVQLKAEGYERLGVDFESINAAASGFWLKYFTAYTNGVVRRIDENVLNK